MKIDNNLVSIIIITVFKVTTTTLFKKEHNNVQDHITIYVIMYTYPWKIGKKISCHLQYFWIASRVHESLIKKIKNNISYFPVESKPLFVPALTDFVKLKKEVILR